MKFSGKNQIIRQKFCSQIEQQVFPREKSLGWEMLKTNR